LECLDLRYTAANAHTSIPPSFLTFPGIVSAAMFVKMLVPSSVIAGYIVLAKPFLYVPLLVAVAASACQVGSITLAFDNHNLHL
jgi:hypothetical protein